MSEVIKDDGKLAELSPESLVIAQGGDPDRDVAAEAEDTEVLDNASEAEASATEAVQDADATGGDGGGKDASTWYGEEDVELARSYGLDEGALGEFGSAEEFRKAALFFDRQLKLYTGTGEKEAEPEPEKTAEEQKAVDDLDVSVFTEENGYDKDTIKLVQAFAADRAELRAIKQQIAESQQRAAEDAQRQQVEQYQAFVSEFHQAVDELGDDLFGDSTKDDRVRLGAADSEPAQRRLKLFQALRDYGDRFGSVSIATKIKRARDIEFWDVIRDRDKRQMLDGIAQQSKKRRPAASANRQQRTIPAQRQKPTSANDIEYILGDPEFQGRWKKVVDE